MTQSTSAKKSYTFNGQTPAQARPANSDLLFEVDGAIARITLNRPEKLNALSIQMMSDLAMALDYVQDTPSIKVVLLRGAGDRAFSVGFDLDGLEMPTNTRDVIRSTERNFNILMRIWNLRVPVIAAVSGHAIAAGSNMAMICDVVVASTKATFGEPEVRHVALSPLLLMPWFGNNSKRTTYLYLSGDTIGAAEALNLGLVSSVVEPEDLEQESLRLAHRLALVPAISLELTKESIRRVREIQGFTSSLQQHRVIDTLALDSVGIEERDHFFDLMKAGDMKAFLTERDGPFKD